MADSQGRNSGQRRDDLPAGVVTEHEPTVTFVPVTEDALSVLTPEQAAAIAGISGFALIVQRGPRTGMTWLLPAGTTRVGRDPDSDIELDDITVSRTHCLLHLDEDGLSLQDAGSTNGSYVNDHRVERTPLRPGDRLLIGKFHLVVAHGDG